MGDRVGYARVSTTDQSLDIQMEQLKANGCHPIYAERRSGTELTRRVELEECMRYLRKGDTLVVTKVDRLGRSVKDLINVLGQLEKKGVEFVSLSQNLDTTTPTGRAMLQMLAVFAELENEFRRERQLDGIAKAKEAGKYRNPKNRINNARLAQAKRLYDEGFSHRKVAELTGISYPTLLRRFKGYSKRKGPGEEVQAAATAAIRARRDAMRSANPPTSQAEPPKAEDTPPQEEPARGIFGIFSGRSSKGAS